MLIVAAAKNIQEQLLNLTLTLKYLNTGSVFGRLVPVLTSIFQIALGNNLLFLFVTLLPSF